MSNLKELAVVLGISAIAFLFLKPFALRFTAEPDFNRRRNLWLFLTCLGFLAPNIWLLPVGGRAPDAGRSAQGFNPVALYLVLLHVIPPVSVPIPFPGINTLFDINNYRVLSLCILVPTIWRLGTVTAAREVRRLQGMDVLLLAYGVLQTVLYVRPDMPTAFLLNDSVTNQLRRLFLFMIDIYALYYAVSRSCSSKTKIVDAMAAFCMICLRDGTRGGLRVLAKLAVVSGNGAAPQPRGFRDAAGVSAAGGCANAHRPLRGTRWRWATCLAVAFGFWIYLQPHIHSALRRVAIAIVPMGGPVVRPIHGVPWLGAVAIYLVAVALDPKSVSAAGSGDRRRGCSVWRHSAHATGAPDRCRASRSWAAGWRRGAWTNRQRLASTSWTLITNHPFFGDPGFHIQDAGVAAGSGHHRSRQYLCRCRTCIWTGRFEPVCRIHTVGDDQELPSHESSQGS